MLVMPCTPRVCGDCSLRGSRALIATMGLSLIAVQDLPAQPRPRRMIDEASECVPRVKRETRLTLKGARVYVEPSSVSTDDGGTLLLGIPSYLGRFDESTKQWTQVRDSIFGAYVRRDGTLEAVPMPIDQRHLFAPRAAKRVDGAWDVIFLELPSPFRAATSDSTVGAWHGILRGAQWDSVNRIPLPDSMQLGILGVSALIRTGDTLTWAAPFGASRAGRSDGAVIVERYGGSWRWRTIDTRVTWIEVASNARGQRRLFAAHGSGEYNKRTHALRMYQLGTSLRELTSYSLWAHLYTQLAPLRADRFAVTFLARSDSGAESWRSVVLDGSTTRIQSTDFHSRYARVSGISLSEDARKQWWIADVRDSSGVPTALEVLVVDPSSRVKERSIANPFWMPSRVHSAKDKDVVVVGPAFARNASREPPSTLLLTVGLDCRESGATR